MNYIQATVIINEYDIEFEYIHESEKYSIHVPKTEQNKHLVNGQKIDIILGVTL